MKINYQGEIIDKEAFNISLNNRAFRYADGLFESIKYANGELQFLEDHYFRLMGSMRFLRFDIPMDWTLDFLAQELMKTIEANNLLDQPVRLRMQVYRDGEGRYLPTSLAPCFVIEAEEMDDVDYPLNEKGLVLDVFQYHHKPSGLLSNMKTLSAQIYTLAAIFAKENKLDDALLTNENGLLLETSKANIFLIQGKKLLTPSLKSGCLKGIIRKVILDHAEDWGYEVVEAEIRPFDLVKSEAVFLTNVSQGIVWVEQYKKKVFKREPVQEISAHLNAMLSSTMD